MVAEINSIRRRLVRKQGTERIINSTYQNISDIKLSANRPVCNVWINHGDHLGYKKSFKSFPESEVIAGSYRI